MPSNHFEEIARKVREWAMRPEHTERQRALAEAAMELALSYNANPSRQIDETPVDDGADEQQDYRVYGCYLCKYVGAANCLCPTAENKCAVSWEEFAKAASSGVKGNGRA